MAIFGNDMPKPEPGLDDAGFWRACAEKRLAFRHCEDCDRHHHPPLPVCPHCQSQRLDWREATGPAEIFSFTEVHHPAHAAVIGRTPYTVVVVAYPEMEWTRIVSNLVGDGEVRIGDRVEIVWDAIGDGMFLPRYRALAQP